MMVRRLLTWPALLILILTLSGLPLLVSDAAAPPGADPAQAGAGARPSSLGLCFVYHDQPRWHDLARELGATMNRWQISWYEVEATRGKYEWRTLDERVDMDRAAGMEVHAILMGTPEWAATGGTRLGSPVRAEVKEEPWTIRAFGKANSSTSPPKNLYLPWDHPDNHWGRFVYETVSHFKGRVSIWELWNEPDWIYFWSGSTQDYYQLLKVGYLAAKAADPQSTVLFGGLQLFHNPDFFQQVLELARQDPGAKEHGYYLDVMPIHLYARSSQTYDNVSWVRWRMKLLEIEKPIWINETGVAVWDDGIGPGYPYGLSVTRQEQAAYLIQAYANALAAGVEKMLIFRLHDGGMEEAFGLVKDDVTRRPAFTAFQTVQAFLHAPASTTRERQGGLVIVTLYGTDRGKVSVIWNEQPTAATYRLPAILGSALQVAPDGRAETIYARDGTYTLSLPGATGTHPSLPADYVVGGQPVIVVEQDTTPPVASAQPLPGVTGTAHFTVYWSGQDLQAGIWNYDVQVRDTAGGQWANWLAGTAQTWSVFEGQDGHTYEFRARARDRAGNAGPYPDQPQAWTTVRLAAVTPVGTPDTVPCAEYLANGGFEEDGGWTIYQTAFPARYVAQPVHGGRRALQTGIDPGQAQVYSFSSAEQTLLLPAAGKIALRYWYQARIAAGDYAYVFVRPAGGGWQTLQLMRADQPAWSEALYDLGAYAGKAITLRFGTFNDGQGGASAMVVDEASIQVCTTTGTPTPTSFPAATATHTAAPTWTPTPQPTSTATPVPTPTPQPTSTATPVPTPTPVPTSTPTPIPTPTFTPTAAPTPAPTAALCSERAANGDFETDEGWTIANTPYQARYTEAVVRTGQRALHLGIPTPAEDRFAYSSADQRFDLPAGQTATLHLWYYVAQGGGAGDYGYLMIQPDGEAWRIMRILHDTTAGWTPFTVDLSHYAGRGVTLRLGMRNDGLRDGQTGLMYVDSLSLSSCRP